MIWFLYAPVAVLTYILCLITNPLVILFCDENGELHGFLHLWQTWDDSCDSLFFMREVCPSFLDYDYDKHYECREQQIEGNRTRLVSISKGVPFSFVGRIQRYFCRLWWLTRNCGYGFAYEWLSKDVVIKNVRTLYKDDYTVAYYDPESHAWTLSSDQPIIQGFLRWEVYLGWKIPVWASGKCRAMIAIRAVFRFE
ncbi:hypothetical protein SAMN02745671_01684 [Anaerovibrio lipolyticus DSM 3074]|uniref:Uncharacterized protein n=2 Tax=Anaerovibrio lipolyticus TaxID=82374 RepID=A0A0B2JY86_9FIRM|nr:hypothetical protein [Anaerovibrio lipolyticus]KHM51611.1 hypothetical protein NZ47_09515 [Anaerovibrio lipolyticus]SHI78776.1 hypothetical protein SAMN02745671_01684 [Anaerovibrio lipolyticus DSM 3074]